MQNNSLDDGALKALKSVAFNQNQKIEGTFLASNSEIIESKSLSNNLEILPIEIALKKYKWLESKLFSLISKEKDEYTQKVASCEKKLGYFIYVKAGSKIEFPIQTCYLINQNRFTQMTHNIVILEKNSQLHLISGCTINAHIMDGVHIGVTEYFLDEGAILTTTMIHSWGSEVEVYPRSSVKVGKNAKFISNYIALTKVKKIEMNPIALIESGGLGEFYSVVYAPKGSYLDIGSIAFLNGKEARANIVSRSVANGGNIVTRGKIIGNEIDSKGKMSCSGLMLNKESQIDAIPELVAKEPYIELSHEANVGMISKESLSYLMASGISEEEAKRLIIEGFLDLKISGLPNYLQCQIDEMIKECDTSSTI